MPAMAEKLPDTETTLWPIVSANVRRVWGRVEPIIKAREEFLHGFLDTQDIYNFLVGGKMQLWLAVRGEQIQACMVTEIVNYPKKTVCRAVFIGGEGLNDWYPLIGEISFWARQNGCDEWESLSHDRIANVLERKGWTRKLHMMTRPL